MKIRVLLALVGVVSPNPRKFRHPNSSPATIACRSMSCSSPRKVMVPVPVDVAPRRRLTSQKASDRPGSA